MWQKIFKYIGWIVLPTALTSLPSWLSYLNIDPTSFSPSWAEFYESYSHLVSFSIPLWIVLVVVLSVHFIPKIFNALYRGSTAGSKPSTFFEKVYFINNVSCRIYTYEGKNALRYQDKIYSKLSCATHGNELKSNNSKATITYGQTLYVCAVPKCRSVLTRDEFRGLEAQAKSLFIKELEKT